MKNIELSEEWKLLQNQFDSYEKFSLVIKIVSLFILFFILHFEADGEIMIIFPLTLWGMDAIWKTFQDRINQRIFIIEEAIDKEENIKPFQFNREWEKSRPGVIGLILEYLKMGLRPTILFPHFILTTVAIIEIYNII